MSTPVQAADLEALASAVAPVQTLRVKKRQRSTTGRPKPIAPRPPPAHPGLDEPSEAARQVRMAEQEEGARLLKERVAELHAIKMDPLLDVLPSTTAAADYLNVGTNLDSIAGLQQPCRGKPADVVGNEELDSISVSRRMQRVCCVEGVEAMEEEAADAVAVGVQKFLKDVMASALFFTKGKKRKRGEGVSLSRKELEVALRLQGGQVQKNLGAFMSRTGFNQ